MKRAKISLENVASQFTTTISDDLTIILVNRSQEKLYVLCKTFGKLDVRLKSIVTYALLYDN